MIKSIAKRLKRANGESLAETLVALLVAALGILLLAGMIVTSTNIIRSSNLKIKEYAEKENELVEQSGEAKQAKANMVSSGGDPVRFNKNETAAPADAEYFQVDYDDNTPVISFRKK